MKAQKSVFRYRIRLCFHDYKLAIENDENDQSHRNIDYKMKRQKSIKQEVGCEFIGIDCEKEVFFFFSALSMRINFMRINAINFQRTSNCRLIN